MSRIGRTPIPVPAGVDVTIGEDNLVRVKGPQGELERRLPGDMRIVRDGDQLIVTRPSDKKQHKALHGLTRSLLANMVEGVARGFRRDLEIQGVGYRAIKAGDRLLLQVGFSHPVVMEPPPGIAFNVETPTRLNVTGIDKELVGEMAARVRKVRPPEPYKGKGIRYAGEVVRMKAGKAGGKKR
ncbi:MAG TPA: 50S ribosomal protein L6 [Dehalococcoidia bacterium]|nr:50S ribosomal protein L6 [Dehalococcoidia bacterium]